VPHETEDEKDSIDNESLASTSTAPTPPLRKRQPLKHPADCLQYGLRKYEMVNVPLHENKKSVASRRYFHSIIRYGIIFWGNSSYKDIHIAKENHQNFG
jgi:hypothetical protein